MVIHTIGDSHSEFAWRNIDNVIIHHLAGKLCYSFGIKKLDVCDIRQFGINDNDSIVFCFGEIDCRAHIYLYENESTFYQEIIDKIVENYFIAIDLNVKTSQLKLKNIGVFNIVPPNHVSNIHTIQEIKKFVLVKNKNDIPWKGSDEDRLKYHLYFNKKLKEKCIEYNYVFIDVYKKYSDENGFLNNNLSDNNVHLINEVFLKEFLIENNF